MATELQRIDGYHYFDGEFNCSHQYLVPAVWRVLGALGLSEARRRLFDLGCGNGAVAAYLAARGWKVVGVDPSAEGVAHAREAHPCLAIHQGSAYDDLAALYGQFPVVLSLEVVEHVFFPRRFVATVYSLLEEGGTVILSTPYHGYWKNLAMALSGKMDDHWGSLTDYGHIKFWSRRTLGVLLKEAGFKEVQFLRVGRMPVLAKSMVAVAKK